MCMFCWSFFVLFLLAIVLSVLLRYTDSDCPFGIFKLFLLNWFLYAGLKTGPYYVIGYGGRTGVNTGFRTITLVLYIGSLSNLATWFPCGRGRTLYILGSLGQGHRYYKYNFWQRSFPHDNFCSVYWNFNKLGHMIPLWKGKNPIYFGVIRSKVASTINIIFDNRVVSTW